jgi:photosystem II stability/assembly factor-like uncharacterized protein
MQCAFACVSTLVALFAVACAGPSASHGSATDLDAAMRWSVQALPGAPSLRGLSVPSPECAWVSGTRGTVARTVDGGASWSSAAPADCRDLDFRSIVAFDSRRAVIATAGTPARVYRTEDGGSSWTVVLSDPRATAFFDAIAFADDRRGYLLGDPQDGAMQLFETADGGASWSLVPSPFLPAPAQGEAMFAASCGCLLAEDEFVAFATGGSVTRYFASSSSGRGFRVVALPLASGAASQGAFAIARCGDERVVAVGGDYLEPARTQGSACWSDDGGVTWHRSDAEPGYRSAVCALADGAMLVSVGPSGCSMSRDGGKSFSSFADDGFHSVRVCGDRIYACGSDGRIGTMRVSVTPSLQATASSK